MHDTSDENHRVLLTKLQAISNMPSKESSRIFPATFDASEKEALSISRPLQWRWDSAREALQHFRAQGVMMRLPLYWQLESPLFFAARDAHAFIFVNDIANIPLGVAAIRATGIDVVVTTGPDSITFATHIAQSGLSQPSWLLVSELSHPPAPLSPLLHNTSVAEELHLFPGLPVLVQCGALIETHDARFHIAQGFSVRRSEKRTYISGTDAEFAFISEYEIPFALTHGGTCACGGEIFCAR